MNADGLVAQYANFPGDGNAWEALVHELMMIRFTPSEYVPVPAKHTGDFGLDGYSYSGQAFQCYRCEEPLEPQERYEKHRDKITADIAKFIRNQSDIEALLGSTTISRWNFVVPLADSALLLRHANKKSGEVLAARLPYVNADFKVHVETALHLRAELLAYSIGRKQLELTISEPTTKAIRSFVTTNNALVSNLRRKLAMLKQGDANSVDTQAAAMVRSYLRGSNLLDQIRRATPNLWNQFVSLQKSIEDELEFLGAQPGDASVLQESLADYRQRLSNVSQALSDENVGRIAQHTVAGVLMRCALDFIE
jgi:hypothetical protein